MTERIQPPTYTQIPNVILDAIADVSDAELRVLLFLARQTFGWHRESYKASTSFIARATGMSPQGVINGVRRLLEKGVMTREPDGDSFSYCLSVFPPLNAVDILKMV